MSLYFKAGDQVRIISAAALPELIGKVTTVTHVGPWVVGEMHPNGCVCIKDNDYLVVDPSDPSDEYGLAVRAANLEPA